jgi:putative methionine-R-sulfoxide reductase with GAF domain
VAVVDRDDIADRLRKLEAVTDSALAHMGAEAVYDELLARVRDLLRTDTATLLLLDRSARQLLVTAAVGIEEEVRQGVLVPVGRGFAGRIAADRQPMVIDHVDESTVVNPLLWERGLRALAGVPLIVEGRLLGVLHVGTAGPRVFTDDDLSLLQMVADRLALAAHTRLSLVERAAAEALQRSLLPAVLPAVPGLSFAARYIPGAANDVGGDWYDVFTLPGDRVGVVMGDVVGHGLAAAVVMGRLRSALRAYALDIDDPAAVLHKLNRKATHFEDGAMATVCYAVVDPSRDHVTIALAGHPPPVLAEVDGTVTLADGPVGPPVGFPLSGGHYANRVLALSPGAVLCFYTDGLVERRDSTIDVGMHELSGAITVGDPDMVCARIMARLVGTRLAEDDIALLAMRRDGRPGEAGHPPDG